MNQVFKNKQLKIIVISGIILLALTFLFLRYDGFIQMMNKLLGVFRPVIIGGVIAFALNKPFILLVNRYMKISNNAYKKKIARIKKENNGVLPAGISENRTTHNYKVENMLGLLTVYFITILFLFIIILIIIPQIASSIVAFSDNFDLYYENLNKYIVQNAKAYFKGNEKLTEWIEGLDLMKKVYSLVEYVPNILLKTFGITASIFRVIIDTILGVILSVYILASKNKLRKDLDIIVKKFTSPKVYSEINYYGKLTSEKFTAFISGQLIEAIVLGCLCFIGMTIFGFEYAVLISTIIGLTNIVPIVGPIIGVIPSIFILLLVNPQNILWFLIFILILQQIESNLIYPRIVGGKMNLPALWVSVAVIVGGGLSGILGMIIGVPMMAVIYEAINEKIIKNNESTN